MNNFIHTEGLPEFVESQGFDGFLDCCSSHGCLAFRGERSCAVIYKSTEKGFYAIPLSYCAPFDSFGKEKVIRVGDKSRMPYDYI